MTEELSGVTVVIIIGGGVLIFLILFIFAKRQLVRFSLRSKRGPHFPIGHGAKKSLKREIDRRIEVIPRIVHEPQLINEEASKFILDPGQKLPSHYFRLKAVDDIKLLEREISRAGGGMSRQPCESLRAFLLSVLAAPLGGRGQRAVHQLCDAYEHARHHPGEFADEEYQAYNRLLLKLIDAARLLKPCGIGHKASPKRTPTRKQMGVRSLLDPSRLRPPGTLGVTMGSANKLAISNVHTQYTNMQSSNTLDYNFDDEVLCVESKPHTPVVVHTQKTDNETTV